MEYLLWLEETAFSTWLRESGPAFFSSLVLHSVAMGFVVGVNVATDLRVLGVAPGVPLSRMRSFRPVAFVAFVVVAVSGALLLTAYPTKALPQARVLPKKEIRPAHPRAGKQHGLQPVCRHSRKLGHLIYEQVGGR